jgi:hypothetical protein
MWTFLILADLEGSRVPDFCYRFANLPFMYYFPDFGAGALGAGALGAGCTGLGAC